MPSVITMPKLSPTMQEGTITKWHKKEGDKVEVGEILFEVATDKATVEHNAIDEGFLRKILVNEGNTASINQPIAIFSQTPDEDIQSALPKEEKKQEQPKEKQEAPSVPPQQKQETAPPPTQTAFTPEKPLQDYQFQFPSHSLDDKIAASPLAKKLAMEKGIDLSTVKGSGPGGRITSKDIDLAQPDQTVTFGRRETPTIAPGTFEEVGLTTIRKIISERLQAAKRDIPHIYVHQEIDASSLITIKDQLKEGNLKVSINDFITRASALTMREHPHCNSGFNAANQSIIHFKTIDIAFAVSIEGGLITPIIRHADYKNLGELSVETKMLATKAREGKLKPEEFKGGSFTISNMGMFHITDFCAIINPPQAAILAVGGIEDAPIVKKGHVVAGKKMHLTLSVDHRVLDGTDAAKWLKTLQKYLENPSLLLI